MHNLIAYIVDNLVHISKQLLSDQTWPDNVLTSIFIVGQEITLITLSCALRTSVKPTKFSQDFSHPSILPPVAEVSTRSTEGLPVTTCRKGIKFVQFRVKFGIKLLLTDITTLFREAMLTQLKFRCGWRLYHHNLCTHLLLKSAVKFCSNRGESG